MFYDRHYLNLYMNNDFQDLVDSFISLGGVAENICLRDGALGRGIFPVDPLRRVKIVTPKSLLIDRNHIGICHGEIRLIDANKFTLKEKEFIELNYNFAWKGCGSACSAEFLSFILMMPESVKSQLLACEFIDKEMLISCLDESRILKRFIDERAVDFEGKSVLASIWDFVNHSSFAAPLRISPYGVETPPMEPCSGEILFKYSGKNSPMSMWKKYGFA